jgi:hypothetical protein
MRCVIGFYISAGIALNAGVAVVIIIKYMQKTRLIPVGIPPSHWAVDSADGMESKCYFCRWECGGDFTQQTLTHLPTFFTAQGLQGFEFPGDERRHRHAVAEQ